MNFALAVTMTTKTVSPFYLEIKRLFGGANYIRFLIYQKAINEQKMKEIDFSTSAAQRSVFPESPS